MGKVLQQDQNNRKALELRLEQYANNSFCVVLAGLTMNLRSGCQRGVCEPTGENEVMCIENETYKSFPFASYQEAKQAYDMLRVQYVAVN